MVKRRLKAGAELSLSEIRVARLLVAAGAGVVVCACSAAGPLSGGSGGSVSFLQQPTGSIPSQNEAAGVLRSIPAGGEAGSWDAVVTAAIEDARSQKAPRVGPLRERNASVASLGSSLPKGGGYRKIGKPYSIRGVVYVPRHEPDYEETGVASWYGDDFHGKKTANGEIYDMDALTAAHRTLPLPSLVSVTNVKTGKSVIVRINDRGPFRKGRIIDVSAKVAKVLGFADHGVANVRVKYVGPAPLDGDDAREVAHLASAR
ncbi:MAG: septal ring lytic transglycosylase RlpA family protein [Alphaproteobacteria bacterium]|nr:septal ring lytic transglycosylase RlpA family protein [Alphaproteobacteria bacterium]